MNGDEIWTWGDVIRVMLFLALPVMLGNFLTDAIYWLVRLIRRKR